MSSAVSWRKMASWEDQPSMAPHMLAGTWAKTTGAMQPRMSVHTSLTSVVAQTMGRQFLAAPSLPSCGGGGPGWPTQGAACRGGGGRPFRGGWPSTVVRGV